MQHLISILDLSKSGIEELFIVAAKFAKQPRQWAGQFPGYVLASLFLEPSTRTRLSFETAMLRLGGSVISVTGIEGTSLTKGESLADMIRTVSSYADCLVLRDAHPGAAKLAGQHATIPVINAGDGSGEHPSQTLCDLFSILQHRGNLDHLSVVLCGDLKHSRTVHSLVFGLAYWQTKLIFAAHPGLEFPPAIAQQLMQDYGYQSTEIVLPELQKLTSWPTCPALIPKASDKATSPVDVIYMTRLQKERLRETPAKDLYMRLNPELLEMDNLRQAIVLHPLPRNLEIPLELDKHPRSRYFFQAAAGVPIRMALLSKLLRQSSP